MTQSKQDFETLIRSHMESFERAVSNAQGEWLVRGIIDLKKQIFPVPLDTKLISKVLEVALLPEIERFAFKHDFILELAEHQNHYPDITLTHRQSHIRFAIDIKSTYRKDAQSVNGMTLGTFTGYFRDRQSRKNIKYPYSSYAGHYVLGIIYTRQSFKSNETNKIYSIEDMENIIPTIKEMVFFFHEKYKIASDQPGSGNTRNIGSVTRIEELIQGTGPFTSLGEEVFDEYWQNYLTQSMAQARNLDSPPYTNLETYFEWKRVLGGDE